MAKAPSRRRLVNEFLGLNPAYLDCRDINHPWRRGGEQANEWGGVDQEFLCPRCNTRRIRVLDHRGYVITNRYPDRPKDYSLKGIGTWDADARAAMRSAVSGILRR